MGADRDQVFAACQQTITGRYPFEKGSTTDVPLADFAKLFSPNGVLDKFFTQSLAPYADTSKADWAWRKESPVGSTLSADTLKQFQRAAYIRDAFFQTGGNQPAVAFAVQPPVVKGPGASAKIEIGGATINSPNPQPASGGLFSNAPPPQPFSNSPTNVQWPGPSMRTAISVTNDATSQPSILERTGPWSLFRLLEAGSISGRADTAPATKRPQRGSTSEGSADSSVATVTSPGSCADRARTRAPDVCVAVTWHSRSMAIGRQRPSW